MRLGLFLPVAVLAIFAAPAICQGMAKRQGGNRQYDDKGGNRQYDDKGGNSGIYLMPYVKKITAAVEALGQTFAQTSPTEAATNPDFSEAEQELHDLIYAIADATDYLDESDGFVDTAGDDMDINGSLDDLKDAVLPVAQGVAKFKDVYEYGGYTRVIVAILVGVNQAFDGFYQALKIKINQAARDKSTGYLLAIICAIDDTIATLDESSALTDADFCKDAGTDKCSDWDRFPKPCQGYDDCDDPRYYLQSCYQKNCFDASCRKPGWCKSGRLTKSKWTPPDWKCHGKKNKPKGPPSYSFPPSPKHPKHPKQKWPPVQEDDDCPDGEKDRTKSSY